MYQIIGLPKTLKIFGIFCLIFFLARYYAQIPSLLSGPVPELWRAVSFSVLIGSLLLSILGSEKIFPWICKLPFISDYFPPISGEWNVRMESNWGVIQKGLGQGDENRYFITTGKVTIKASFFKVDMSFESDSSYSESKAINVSVRPGKQLGLFELNYLYLNHTLVPEDTDSSTHTGAARVFVKKTGDDLIMIGTYFTDRNWTKGLNTAGKVTFTRGVGVS